MAENGLYIGGGGMEEFTGSPRSNSSGDMHTQKQCPLKSPENPKSHEKNRNNMTP